MDVMEAVDGALDNVKNAMDNAIQVNTPINILYEDNHRATKVPTY